MLFNLLIGILAGIGSRYVEEPLKSVLQDKMEMPEADIRVLAFILIMLAASLLIAFSGANGMPLVLLIGGGLGIFGSHVLKFGRAQKDALEAKMKSRNASAAEDVKDEVETAASKAKKTTRKPASKTTKAASTSKASKS